MEKSVDRMLFWFRMKGGRATLGDIVQSREPWSYEFRARKTELNARGGPQIVLAQQYRSQPSQNVYELRESDASGQLRMAI